MLNHSFKTVTINKQRAIEVRDYLMVSLTYFNCLRASNLKSITLKDVGKINPNDKIDRARLKKRKIQNITVICPKIILLSQTHLQQIKLYIENIRPFVTKDDKKHPSQRCLFTSTRFSTQKPLGQQIDQWRRNFKHKRCI